MYAIRAFLVWLILIGAEFFHAVLRVLFLVPLIGDFRARQIAVFTGSLIILGVAYLFIGWIGAHTVSALLTVGVIWVGLTVLFEFSFGRLVLGYSWDRLFEDYDLSKGGLLHIGILFLFFAPLIAKKLRSLTVNVERRKER